MKVNTETQTTPNNYIVYKLKSQGSRNLCCFYKEHTNSIPSKIYTRYNFPQDPFAEESAQQKLEKKYNAMKRRRYKLLSRLGRVCRNNMSMELHTILKKVKRKNIFKSNPLINDGAINFLIKNKIIEKKNYFPCSVNNLLQDTLHTESLSNKEGKSKNVIKTFRSFTNKNKARRMKRHSFADLYKKSIRSLNNLSRSRKVQNNRETGIRLKAFKSNSFTKEVPVIEESNYFAGSVNKYTELISSIKIFNKEIHRRKSNVLMRYRNNF